MNAAVMNSLGVQLPTGMASQRDWVQCDDNFQMKVLSVDAERYSVEVLIKVAAGYQSERHRHTCETHAYVLEGRIVNHTAGCEFGPGDYCFQPMDDEHVEEFPEETTAYVSYRGTSDKLVEFFDDDGKVCGEFKISDFAAMV
ncbi:MAG: cupin domain-containing protein [Pseudomonadota bacterium]